MLRTDHHGIRRIFSESISDFVSMEAYMQLQPTCPRIEPDVLKQVFDNCLPGSLSAGAWGGEGGLREAPVNTSHKLGVIDTKEGRSCETHGL